MGQVGSRHRCRPHGPVVCGQETRFISFEEPHKSFSNHISMSGLTRSFSLFFLSLPSILQELCLNYDAFSGTSLSL